MNVLNKGIGQQSCVNYPAIAILCIAAILRLAGISFGLPDLFHQDEPIIVNHALAIGVQGWNPHFFVLPPFTIYASFLLYTVYFVAGTCMGWFTNAEDFAMQFLHDPTVIYLIGRIFLGVCFGVLTVYGVMKIGAKLIGRSTGIGAGLVLALSYIHVQHSHYIYTDIALAFVVLALFGIVACAVIRGDPSLRHYLYAGMLMGWGMSIKYTMFYFFPALIVAHILLCGVSLFRKEAFLKLFWAIVTGMTLFFIIAPFTFLDFNVFWAQIQRQSQAEGAFGLMHHLRYSLAQGMGIPALSLAVAGLGVLIQKHARVAWLILAFITPYYVVNMFFTQPFARYMLPLVPLLCLLAGIGWVFIMSAFLPSRFFKYLLSIVLVLSMAIPSVYSDFLMLQPDTRTQSLAWFHAHAASGDAVALASRTYAPRLRQSAEQIQSKYQWLSSDAADVARRKRLDLQLQLASQQGITYEVFTLEWEESREDIPFLFLRPYLPSTMQALREARIRYIVLNTSEQMEKVRDFRRILNDNAFKIQTFNPYWDRLRTDSYDVHDATAAPHLLRELFSRRRLGPVLDIYELNVRDEG